MGGGGSAPKPPKFVPLDIPALTKLMEEKDTSAWAKSHQDLAKRLPLIPKGVKASTDNALLNLQGQQDPGLTALLNSSGSGVKSFGTTVQAQARNTGKSVVELEQRHRGYFSDLLQANPKESRGPNMEDILQLYADNANSGNRFDTSIFQSKINQYNSSIAQGAQNTGAVLSGITGLAGIAAKGYQNYQYNQPSPLDVNYYGSAPSPYWGNFNNYGLGTANYGGFEGTVNWGNGTLPVMRATPVTGGG